MFFCSNSANLHSKLTIFRVKSVKIYTGQKKFGACEKYEVWWMLPAMSKMSRGLPLSSLSTFLTLSTFSELSNCQKCPQNLKVAQYIFPSFMSQFEQVVSLIASARYQLKRKFSTVSQYKQIKEKFHTCSSFAMISSNKKCGILLQDSADTAFWCNTLLYCSS